jgi:hypothetical protein
MTVNIYATCLAYGVICLQDMQSWRSVWLNSSAASFVFQLWLDLSPVALLGALHTTARLTFCRTCSFIPLAGYASGVGAQGKLVK